MVIEDDVVVIKPTVIKPTTKPKKTKKVSEIKTWTIPTTIPNEKPFSLKKEY